MPATPQDTLKAAAAAAAAAWAAARLDADPSCSIGVGSGSTVNHVIDALAPMRARIGAVAAASADSEARLRERGMLTRAMSGVNHLSCYLDGADEVMPGFALLKGRGGALAREKVLAGIADEFICVVTADKLRPRLGAGPLPVETLAAALAAVCSQLAALGGEPVVRDFTSDNGNPIVDWRHGPIDDPAALETRINQIPGAVCNGIFARRRADTLALADARTAETGRTLSAEDAWPGPADR